MILMDINKIQDKLNNIIEEEEKKTIKDNKLILKCIDDLIATEKIKLDTAVKAKRLQNE